MSRLTRWYDYITFNIYFLGLTTLSQTNGIVIPLLVEHFMGSEQKGTYFGIYRLWTLMMALLAQAFFGMLSDRSRLRWGRRRPFIFTGTLLDVVFVAAIALTAGLAGYSIDGGQNAFGFWLMFGIAVLLQLSSNVAHSAQQGVMPDLVPEEKRGRFSAVKAMLELPVPLILVALVIGPIFKNEALSFAAKIGVGMAVAMGVVLLSMLDCHVHPGEAARRGAAPAGLAAFPAPAGNDGGLSPPSSWGPAGFPSRCRALLAVDRLAARLDAGHGAGGAGGDGNLGGAGGVAERAHQRGRRGGKALPILHLVGGQPAGVPGGRHQPVHLCGVLLPGAAGL